MEKQKSTCKVNDLYGVEIGKYVIALEDGTVLNREEADGPYGFEIVPDESGTVEVTEEQAEIAESVNYQLEARDKFAEESGIPASEYISAPEEDED